MLDNQKFLIQNITDGISSLLAEFLFFLFFFVNFSKSALHLEVKQMTVSFFVTCE